MGGKQAQNISAAVSFDCIIHVLPTNYLGLAPGKCQYSVELMETICPQTLRSVLYAAI